MSVETYHKVWLLLLSCTHIHHHHLRNLACMSSWLDILVSRCIWQNIRQEVKVGEEKDFLEVRQLVDLLDT